MSFPPFPYRVFDRQIPPPSSDDGGLLCVEFDSKWLAYICSLLTTLVVEGTWQSDVDRATNEAQNLLRAFMTAKVCQRVIDTSGVNIDEDCDMKFRMCGGKLQFCDCGTWTDVPSCDGDTGGTPQPTQPGGGTPQPTPNGGTEHYCGALAGLQKWLLPAPVSTGDVLLFDTLLGAANDGIESTWHCPDGWLFALGNCFETPVYNGGTDPLIGTRHMSIIAKIGSTYYDVLNVDLFGTPQPFTVPSGHANDPCLILFNVDYGGSIYGEVTFCVTLTNNQVGTFTHTFDFTHTDGGFTMLPIGSGQTGAQGHWIPFVGWVSDYTQFSTTHGVQIVEIQSAVVSARNLLEIDVYYSITAGVASGPVMTDHVDTILAGVDTARASRAYVSVAPPWLVTFGPASADRVAVSIAAGSETCNCNPGGAVVVTSIVVKGQGVDPF